MRRKTHIDVLAEIETVNQMLGFCVTGEKMYYRLNPTIKGMVALDVIIYKQMGEFMT